MNEQVKFLSIWASNSILLLILSFVLKNKVVLGNVLISNSLAAIISGFILAGVAFLVPVVIKKANIKIKNQYGPSGILFAASVVVLWIIKRFADITGLGISSIFYVFVVAILATLIGWGMPKINDLIFKGNLISKK